MASQYKLTYLNITGFGEQIRYLFSYGGIEFEDDRIDEDKWPEIKPTMPFGLVPILVHNGKVINQSLAISRYVAKLVKLIGENDWENLEIDAVADTIRDLHTKVALFYYESDGKQREKQREVLVKETIPYYMERFNSIVKKNKGHLAVGRLTWVDLMFVASFENINPMMEHDVIASYPELVDLQKKISSIPNIKRYIDKRPKTTR